MVKINNNEFQTSNIGGNVDVSVLQSEDIPLSEEAATSYRSMVNQQLNGPALPVETKKKSLLKQLISDEQGSPGLRR